jgi:hypothetical protein
MRRRLRRLPSIAALLGVLGMFAAVVSGGCEPSSSGGAGVHAGVRDGGPGCKPDQCGLNHNQVLA